MGCWLSDVQRVLGGGGSASEQRNAVVLASAIFLAVVPLEASQLVMLMVGAVAYALLQPLRLHPAPPPKQKVAKYMPPPLQHVQREPEAAKMYVPRPLRSDAARRGQPVVSQQPRSIGRGSTLGNRIVLTATVKPIAPLLLKAASWNDQVDELVAQLTPTALGDRAVQQLVDRVRRVLGRLVPEAEIAGFASGAPVRGRAFAVAVPDLDIVVCCPQSVLSSRLQAAGSRSKTEDRRQMLKLALRAFTDTLVASGDFKFRRSAFGSEELKVTVLPAGDDETAVPIDLSVNIATPLHNAALLAECARLDPRARDLVLLVRRWARDRGICHAPKGHLSPYAWTLMTMYFLQVGLKSDDEAVLPSFADFQIDAAKLSSQPHVESTGVNSVGRLFTEFMTFYGTAFDFRNEAVSIRTGVRAPPSAAIALNIVLSQDGASTEVGLSIEDPFDRTRNVGSNVTAEGLSRLRQELARARSLMAAESCSVMTMFQPWAPSEDAAAA